jgi:hypothetical protein
VRTGHRRKANQVNVVDAALIVTTGVTAAWWAVARTRQPIALGVLSLGAFGVAVITLLMDGMHWQLVSWQLLAVACAAAAGLRRWSPAILVAGAGCSVEWACSWV